MSAVNPLPQSETAEQRHEPSMEEILASIRRIIADDQSLPGRLPIREAEPAAPPLETARDAPFAASVPTPMARQEPAYAAAFVAAPPDPAHLSAVRAPSEIGLAHGQVSAPQFAMPHGPTGDDPVTETSGHEAVVEPQMEVPLPSIRSEPSPPAAEAALEPEAMPEPIQSVEPTYTVPDVGLTPHAPASEDANAPGPQRDAPPLFSTATNSAVSEAFNMLAASRLADNSDELMDLAREMIRPLLRTWIDDNLPSMVERMIRAEIERVARGGR